MAESSGRDFLRARRAEHPPFVQAVLADARLTAALRGERSAFVSALDGLCQVLRLVCVTDAFGAQVCYRAKARLQHHGVPMLPRLLHRLAIVWAQVCIGDPVIVRAGVYLPHGQVVVDGLTEVGSGCSIRPFVTIGLKEGDLTGPTLERSVVVGTGAKIFGPITVGEGSVVGANAVVVRDVPRETTVAGVPAVVVPR